MQGSFISYWICEYWWYLSAGMRVWLRLKPDEERKQALRQTLKPPAHISINLVAGCHLRSMAAGYFLDSCGEMCQEIDGWIDASMDRLIERGGGTGGWGGVLFKMRYSVSRSTDSETTKYETCVCVRVCACALVCVALGLDYSHLAHIDILLSSAQAQPPAYWWNHKSKVCVCVLESKNEYACPWRRSNSLYVNVGLLCDSPILRGLRAMDTRGTNYSAHSHMSQSAISFSCWLLKWL